MLAYVDNEVAGWCGFAPRPLLPRLEQSRTIPKVDELPVWSILCFLVRVGYRRRGIAAALLDGVVDYARRSGAPGLEAYPIDPEGGRVDTSFGYVGVTPMFEKAGFRRVVETDAHSDRRPRILMRLEF
jgi:GNAT superfamily N-acetyltransferase